MQLTWISKEDLVVTDGIDAYKITINGHKELMLEQLNTIPSIRSEYPTIEAVVREITRKYIFKNPLPPLRVIIRDALITFKGRLERQRADLE